MRNIILAFITLISLVFIGCTDSEQKTVDNKRVIKVGTSGGYFPFTFLKMINYKDLKLMFGMPLQNNWTPT